MSLINVAEVEISPTISFTRVHWTEFCGVFLFLKVRLGSFGAVVGRNLVHSKMFQLLGRVWGGSLPQSLLVPSVKAYCRQLKPFSQVLDDENWMEMSRIKQPQKCVITIYITIISIKQTCFGHHGKCCPINRNAPPFPLRVKISHGWRSSSWPTEEKTTVQKNKILTCMDLNFRFGSQSTLDLHSRNHQ